MQEGSHTMDNHEMHEHGADKGGHGDDHGAHGGHAGHEEMFRRRFWISLVLTIPILLFSPMLQEWLGFSMPTFLGDQWVGPFFAFVVFFYGGTPFLQMAVPELRRRQPGMMTLISLAITVAFSYSVFAVFTGVMGFFWEMATLIDVMLLGHWIEMRSIRRASGALEELAKLLPDTAERILPDGSTEEVPLEEIEEDDLLMVRPGSNIPADGVVEEGQSDVNQAMITGESEPVSKAPGDEVVAGTINEAGSLRVRVTATGEETTLAGIMRLVEEARESKSRTQVLADRAAGWLFYIALGVAILTAIGWGLSVGLGLQTLERVVTVLVIACPHALGLAIPLVVAITTSLGARNGILVRDRLALERAREIDTVVFDKTGTLTEGEFGVAGMATVEGWDEERALALAAGVEGDSEHLIARAIRQRAEEQDIERVSVEQFEALEGRGVRAQYGDETVYVGGPQLLEMLELDVSQSLRPFVENAEQRGQTVIHLVAGEGVVASFALADVIRPESYRAVERLKEMGIGVVMLTGDSEAVARAVAGELGIDTVFANVLPEEKNERLIALQEEGKRVAMVGDGINDAPVLVRADVGIAIGSGTDVAIESAGIILVQSNPLDVVKIFTLSRATYKKMVQNLVWAAGYNVFALPLAAGVLAPYGILLSPAVGALLMSMSTVIVAANAQLLRNLDLGGGEGAI